MYYTYVTHWLRYTLHCCTVYVWTELPATHFLTLVSVFVTIISIFLTYTELWNFFSIFQILNDSQTMDKDSFLADICKCDLIAIHEFMNIISLSSYLLVLRFRMRSCLHNGHTTPTLFLQKAREYRSYRNWNSTIFSSHVFLIPKK